MEFLDRIVELAELNRCLERSDPQFVVVYGRRRLGKSTLIKRALTGNDIYYMAGDFVDVLQMDMLRSQLAERFPAIGLAQYPQWEDLFLMLNKVAESRFTLCLDEFPYMVKHSPELPSVLQRLIDSKNLKYNIVICGSSQRMMQTMVLSPSEPLYGRANALIKVSPIPLPYLQQALHTDAVATIEEYSVWGGVPRYWEIREEYSSFKEALASSLFSPIGVLNDEPKRLFLDESSSTVQSESLMSVIGAGVHRLSEIGSRMGRDSTALSLPIDRLIRMNYLRREIPFGESLRKSKKSLYLIDDPLMDFYYTFIVPNLSSISRGRTGLVEEYVKDRFDGYVGRHWEHLCREAVSGNQVLDEWWGEASRWWGTVKTQNGLRAMEFDVVALSRDGKSMLVGECKWTNPEVARELHKTLMEKISCFPMAQGLKVFPVLFLKNRPKDAEIVKDIQIFYPEDVIQLMQA